MHIKQLLAPSTTVKLLALRDYYITDDDGASGIATSNGWNNQVAQIFTPSTSYLVTSVKLKLYTRGTPAPTLYIAIQGTTGSPAEPDGVTLASGNISTSGLDSSAPGDWEEITFDTPYALVGGVAYAIVAYTVDIIGNMFADSVSWRHDRSSPAYAEGHQCVTDDGGASWDVMDGDGTNRDHMFEVWGYA